jgi:hypothetical protein
MAFHFDIVMEKKFKDKLPKWYIDENTEYDLILSDDLDSLASCMALQQFRNWNIKYFYRFDSMGKTRGATNEAVGVDIALCNGKTIDNHVTKLHKEDISNPESINLNCMEDINRANYFDKYCGSTLLTVWSLFDLQIPKSDEGKMILLCIDSSYLGFYSDYKQFRDANRFYLCDVLGLEELYEFQKKCTRHDFKNINNQYKLDYKIKATLGHLSTDIKLEEVSRLIGLELKLPEDNFILYKQFLNNAVPLDKDKRYKTKLPDITEDPFSAAVTGRDFLKYSTEYRKDTE